MSRPHGSNRPNAPRAVQPAFPVARGIAPPPGAAAPARPALPPLPYRPSLFTVLLQRGLRWIIVGLIGVVIFIVGMEVGYRRADDRWRQVAAERDSFLAKVETADRDRKRDPDPAAAKVQPSPVAKAPAEAAPPVVPKQKSGPGGALAVVTFSTHVRPIFKAKCTSCHGDFKTRGGLDLRTAAAALKGGESGPGLRPGSAQSSALWEYVADGRMPPGKEKLSVAEKTLLRRWIDSGAK